MGKEHLTFTSKNGNTIDTATFGIVVLADMPVASYEAKGVFEEDWPDEDGVDTYDAASVKIKANDLSIPMAAVGDNCVAQYRNFLNALTTGATLWTMGSEWTGETYNGVRFVKADAEAPVLVNATKKHMKFKLVLRITNPR